jgi:biopolymer transport protein ExbD
MAFTSFNSRNGMQPMSEINTTPLVDVMLVLLVIFIITAPLFHQAVPVDLPRVDSSKLDDKPRVVQLAIDAEGRVFVDGEPVEAARLGAALAERVKTGESVPELHLRADRATRCERITEAMAKAQKAGMTKIAFVTSGESTTSK